MTSPEQSEVWTCIPKKNPGTFHLVQPLEEPGENKHGLPGFDEPTPKNGARIDEYGTFDLPNLG